MNIQDIITEFGAYYQDRGQNISRLYQLARRSFETQEAFTPIVTNDTIWQAGQTQFQRIVQPFQSKFTPTGQLTVEPLQIRMFQNKGDVLLDPSELEATWLGFLTGPGVKRSEWPFVRWFLEVHYFPQIQEDYELNEIAYGKYLKPTAGTPGAAGTAMDGCLTQIKDLATAGKIAPISMGAIPTGLGANKLIVDYFEDFGKQIDKKYWKKPMDINVSEDLERSFEEGQLEKYGKNIVGNEQGLKVKFSNLTVKGYASHNGSDRIWCTPKGNAIVLKKRDMDNKLIDLQSFDRQIKVLSDWWIGVGYIVPDIVFCNDRDKSV